jgi:hypothetical protein
MVGQVMGLQVNDYYTITSKGEVKYVFWHDFKKLSKYANSYKHYL